MNLSEQEVAHVARLARLQLSPEELKLYREQLGRIFDLFTELDRVDTSAAVPMAHVQGLSDVFRADTPVVDPARDALRENAPATEDRYFKVPKVIG